MSAIQTRRCLIEYRWLYMIPWYRQVLSLVYGLGVMLIALWALEQGSGRLVILGVVGMSMLTLTLIFGIEVDTVSVGDYIQIDFSDTSGEGDKKKSDGSNRGRSSNLRTGGPGADE